MYFSRVICLFAFLFAFSLISVAEPVADDNVVVERTAAGTADFAAVFETLKAATDSILPQIDALANSGITDAAPYTALFNQLADSFKTANTSVQDLKDKSLISSAALGPPKGVLAHLIADILIAVITTVNNVLVKVGLLLPGLAFLVTVLEILLAVDAVVAGVLFLVSGLIFNAVGLLGSIGLAIATAILKLHI